MAYAELLVEKVPAALKALGNKNEMTVRDLAKKTKSNDYNAGVIAAAMVDTEVTEVLKVGTPFRTFIMNIAGLAFLVLTWQTLLGDAASAWQTSLTYVGAGLSLAVIISLYVSRKTQVKKFRAELDAGAKMLPTAAETTAAESLEEIEEPEEPEVYVEPEETSTELDDTPSETEDTEETYDEEIQGDTPPSDESVEPENEEDSF
jgi:hypothetical protein